MAHKTTLEIPDDIWEDIQKRRFRNEGGVKSLMLRAYRAQFMPWDPQARSEAGSHNPGQSPEPPGVAKTAE